MFQEFYGFTRVPFSRTIATQDLFPTAGQKELNARLAYLVRERGFGLVTGEIGSCKSTEIYTLSLHDALPILSETGVQFFLPGGREQVLGRDGARKRYAGEPVEFLEHVSPPGQLTGSLT